MKDMGGELLGIAASSGIAIAEAFVLREESYEVPHRTDIVVEQELVRLQEAVELSSTELKALYEKTKASLGEDKAQIIEAYMFLLRDPSWQKAIINRIENETVNAEYALDQANQQWIAKFEKMKNAYMRERAADVRDVGKRVMRHLLGSPDQSFTGLDTNKQFVLITHDLTPSDTAQLDSRYVKGFATDNGGRTSHTAIMARSMDIPAVVGLNDATQKIDHGAIVIIDGDAGKVLWNPSEAQLSAYKEKQQEFANKQALYRRLVDQATVTIDGHRVELAANIGGPEDVGGALHNGAEGVGLFRSEFLYMNRGDLPSEEEQFAAYKQVAEMMKDRPVIIRTLDIGGDKELSYLPLPKEMNPFLGYRAIRLCLDRKDLFRAQVRAILRASAFGNVGIMFPMIATLTELREAKAVVTGMMEELRLEGITFNPLIRVGIMIEIPASAMIADLLAKEVDFFSIGTNDLIQYTMACDRMNEKVSYLYQPYHPAVLRLIRLVIEAAHRHNKWVGMCGEMAGDLTAVPVLLGLGLDEFSMSASSILPVRELIGQLDIPTVKQLTEQVMQMETQDEIEAHIRSFIEKRKQ